ncbi:S-adenosyl-L-methionine-dependent methyltransferase [Morchella snyderi]|nr:S-adenosyl-L-methionine-dependent methyltransferase [Morchella snyderi]
MQPRTLSSQPHEQPQQNVHPINRIAFDNERAEWYKGYQPLSSLRTGMFDIPGLNNWEIDSSSEPRSPTPGTRSPSPTFMSIPSDNFQPLSEKVSFSNHRTPTGNNYSTPSRKRIATTPLPPPEEHFREEEIDIVIYKGYTLRERKAVELEDGTFLRIHSILNRIGDDGEEEVFLKGAKYKRARDFMGLLGLKKNEVALSSASETVSISKVLRTRILIMTNAAFPKYRDVHGNAQVDEIEGRLICRWKLIVISKQESYIWRLREQEADKEFQVQDRKLREDWRGKVVKLAEILKVTSREHIPSQRKPRYVEKSVISDKVASPEIGGRAEGIKETHHTEIVANESSIELKETCFETYPRGDLSVLGRRRYEATVDSRTPSGRFLGHFQGTYTPNTFSLPSLCNSQSNFTGVFSQTSRASSVASTPRLFSDSFGGSDNTWSLDKIDPLSGFELLGKDLGYFMPLRYDNSRRSPLPVNMTSQGISHRGGFENRGAFEAFEEVLKEPPPLQPAFAPQSISQKKRYRFGDAFCGGGGMSSGARSAGLINAWSFDFNRDAINTYRRNFPDCETYYAAANDFVAFPPEELLVDIVHLSPPCQPHSPAHTIPGKDDDRNEASLFCIKECLEAARPRMVTLEQTDGILNRQEWFRSLVLCFTDLGFSVSWKVLHGVEYGVPQTRKRLFLLAASPGEVLPHFPAPRYAHPRVQETSKLTPPRTVRDAIGSIPYGVTSHEPTPFPDGFRPSPVDFDQPLRATILASGGPYDVHPSGLRPFTPRELACLQTFPITHDFQGSPCQRKKQIGNAVPPKLAEALLKEVRRTLERVDKEREKEIVEKAKKTVLIEVEEDIIYGGSKKVEKPMKEMFPDIVCNKTVQKPDITIPEPVPASEIVPGSVPALDLLATPARTPVPLPAPIPVLVLDPEPTMALARESEPTPTVPALVKIDEDEVQIVCVQKKAIPVVIVD